VRFLLDTHLLLWIAGKSKRVPEAVRKDLSNTSNEYVFSSASLWEIAIKRGLGREDFRIDPRALRQKLLDNGYAELSITGEHALRVTELPALHKDPFDRILLAQAFTEGLTLITADEQLAEYPGPVRKV
jgi:PIN domain nuclease of toxin-antitoxin system